MSTKGNVSNSEELQQLYMLLFQLGRLDMAAMTTFGCICFQGNCSFITVKTEFSTSLFKISKAFKASVPKENCLFVLISTYYNMQNSNNSALVV